VKFVRISISVVCAILVVATGLVSMLLFNLDQKAFIADTYQQAFANERFYQRLPTIIARGLVASPQKNKLPRAMQGLTVENWENFINAMLPPDTLQAMGEDALDSLVEYLNGKSDTAGISLVPLKESMAGDAGTQAVMDLMNTQPDCTLSQIAQMTVAFLSESDILLCNPPEDALPLITPIISAQLQFASEVIPDQAIIARANANSQDQDSRNQLRVLRLFMRLSPLVPFGLLLTLSLLAVRSLRDWLGWWGVPITITGVLAILTSLLGAPFVGFLLLRFLIRSDSVSLPPAFIDSGSQLASAIVEQLLRPTLLQGLFLAGLGILLVAVAILTKRLIKTEPDEESEKETDE
jgi:hypothetical protein